MNINVEKFLAITAALAAFHVAGCSSDKKAGAPGAGGADAGTGGATSTGGKDGGTGGKGGTGGAGTGGKTDTDASVSDASTGDAGGTDSGTSTGPCLGDEAVGFDANTDWLAMCETVPHLGDHCAPDSGMEGVQSYTVAYDMCNYAKLYLRRGAFAELISCFKGIPAGCSTANNDAAFACFDKVAARTCERQKFDGGPPDPCTAAFAGCPGVTAEQCHNTIRSFTDESMDLILPCLLSATVDGGNCGSTFYGCVPLGVSR